MISYSQAIQEGTALLNEGHVPDSQFDSESLLSYVLGISRFELLLNKQKQLADEEYYKYIGFIKQRALRVPLQHLTNVQYFMGRPFHVSSDVLIPRGETELLCEQVILHVNNLPSPNITILDLCTGSGALGITLALELPQAKVSACDISAKALAIATQNADFFKAPVTFFQGDFLNAVTGKRFDLIISNPPYIPTEDLENLQKEVLYEPGIALDGGMDGLDFYRKLAKEGKSHLNLKGSVFCEIGYDQGTSVPALFKEAGFIQIEVNKDLHQLERMVVAHT